MGAGNAALAELHARMSKAKPENMLRTRLLVLILLIPSLVGLIVAGGLIMTSALLVVLVIAAWEYWQIFNKGGYAPSGMVLLGGMPLLVITQYVIGLEGRVAAMTILVMLAMIVHMISFENGKEKPATDFGITIGGLVCIGWLGSYLIPLRSLPNGMYWALTIIPSAMLADAGGYIFGKWIGKHKLCRRLSPNKTWEGFFGGILFGVTITGVLASLWHLVVPEITLIRGLILGVIMAVFPLFGDLGISMIKRQFGLKDISNIIPGHGGVLDRFDTMLWAVPIGFYLVTWFWGQ